MNRTLLILLIYTIVIAGIAALNGTLVALALPLVIALALAFLEAPQEPALRAVRTVSADRVAQGQPLEVRLTITNEGAHLHELLLEDRLPRGLDLIEGKTTLLTSLAPGASVELSYTLQGRRGLHAFPEVQATVRDRLGVFMRQALVEAPAQVFVLPDLMRLRQASIRPRRTRVYSGMIPARQGGPGIEFFGVREYQPGDPTRWLNARATARHEQAMFVNEFEQERVADIGIILDARQRSDVRGRDGSLFEHSVQATAALADLFLTQGNRVGMLVYGNSIDWTFPGYGKFQRERILRALASAEPGDRAALETLESIPTRLFPVRSQLIVISPLVPEDQRVLMRLRAHGYQLLVISPDPIGYERDTLGNYPTAELGARFARLERDLLLRRIRQAGIPVVDWRVDTPFQQAAMTAFGRHLNLM